MMVRKPIRSSSLLLVPWFALGCSEGLSAAADAARSTPELPVQEIEGGGGVNLPVYEGGNPAGPPIVFIHAFTQNSLAWDRQFSGTLAEEFRLVAFDLRGHGASAKPLDAQSYTDARLWADDVAAIIRTKALERPVLVGSSYGGYVIADYLRAFGDAELGGAVFVGPVTKMGSEEAMDFLTEEALELFGGVLSAELRANVESTRAFMRLLFTRPQPPEALEMAIGSAMMVPPSVRLAMFSRQLDNDDILAALRIPTLVVHGADDRIVRQRSAEHIVASVPGAALRVYDGVGHAPFVEDPDRFDRDLAEFVRAAQPGG